MQKRTAFLCMTVLSLLVILSCNFAPMVFAQDVEVQLQAGHQDLWGTSVPLTLAVVSPVNVGQVRVQWVVPYGMQPAFGESMTYQASNLPVYDHFVVSPEYAGTYAITATISGIYNGEPFDKSATTIMHVDSGLNVAEGSGVRTLLRIVYILVAIGALGLFVFFMKDVYNYFRNRFHSWLDKE